MGAGCNVGKLFVDAGYDTLTVETWPEGLDAVIQAETVRLREQPTEKQKKLDPKTILEQIDKYFGS